MDDLQGVKKEMKQWVTKQLQDGKVREIYEATLKSLLERQTPEGYFPESFTGRYDGAFSRSIGAHGLFLTELGMYDKAKSLLSFLFDLVEEHHLPRIPHWFTQDGATIDMFDQIDGAAHCILAYATLCMAQEDAEFEDRYFTFACKEILSYFSEPYFIDGSKALPLAGGDWDQYDAWIDSVLATEPIFQEDALNLVQNFNFEHTREYHYWHCYDILTQTFVGAAADKMILLAEKRGNGALASWLGKKVKAHRYGVRHHFTFCEDGKTMYLEMRVPTKERPDGIPFDALGWPCFSPIAAEWSGCDPEIFLNTIKYVLERTSIVDPVSQAKINTMEYMPGGQIFPEIFGKSIAWTMEYYQRTGNWAGIAEWLKFFNVYAGDGILTEKFFPIDEEGVSLVDENGKIRYCGDLPENARWGVLDRGNGEQCVWFCRAIYHLCRELHISL